MVKLLFDLIWICASLVPYIIFFIIGIEMQQTYMGIPSNYICAIMILLIGVGVTYGSLKYYISHSERDNVKISSIRPAEPTYIPLYISYFIITLGITKYSAFSIITLLLIIFIFKTKVFYFNVLAYIFGYHFYEVVSEDGVSLMLILKEKDIKKAEYYNNLIRLNNFSFIEGGK